MALHRLADTLWEVMETTVGLGLSHSYGSLLASDGPTGWRTLWYELGTLGLLGNYLENSSDAPP